MTGPPHIPWTMIVAGVLWLVGLFALSQWQFNVTHQGWGWEGSKTYGIIILTCLTLMVMMAGADRPD